MKTTQMNITWEIPTDIGIIKPMQQIMLQPNKEITLMGFHTTFILDAYGLKGTYYSPEFIEWNGDVTVEFQGRGNLWSTHYYWFYGYGLAVSVLYAYMTQKEARIKASLGKVEKQSGYKDRKIIFRYFRIGCNHENKEEYSGQMFEHLMVCKDCGYKLVTWSD